MMLNDKRTSLATRLLWSLQESTTAVEGLLLTRTDGLTITSTLLGGESTQRLAAVATAMFLLCDKASEAWGRGTPLEVEITLRNESDQERANVYHVVMRPVGDQAVLIAVCRRDALPPTFHRHLDRASAYLRSVLEGETPALPRWTT